MNTLLDSGVRPDGVVALNDMLASGVMYSIQMHDLRIPEDISVIGFDNSDDSQYLSPALTSIAPGLEAVARLSVRALKNRGAAAPVGRTPHCRRRLVVVRSYGNVRAAVRQLSVNARSWSA